MLIINIPVKLQLHMQDTLILRLMINFIFKMKAGTCRKFYKCHGFYIDNHFVFGEFCIFRN